MIAYPRRAPFACNSRRAPGCMIDMNKLIFYTFDHMRLCIGPRAARPG